MSLHSKMAEAAGQIGNVPKAGWNDFHKYHYVKEEDVVGAVRKALSERGVAVYVSSKIVEMREWRTPPTQKNPDGKPTLITNVQVEVTFADGESGETYTITSAGSGDDASDKGIYKAVTGAMKYALMKTFLISTGDDPEEDRASQSSPQAHASRAATSEPSRAHASGGVDVDPPPVAGVELPPDPLVRASDEQWREIKQLGLDLGRRIGADEAAVRYAQLLDELRPMNPASLTEAEADRLIAVLKKEAAQYKVPA